MKKIFIILLILIFIFSNVFSYDLIQYSGGLDSHACKPNEAGCAYQNLVQIDDSAAPPGNNGGQAILKISSVTNAHVELNTYANYPINILLKGNVLSNDNCFFTSPGDNCYAFPGNLTYACGFEISDENNAHLSACNTFGSDGIKFCCNIPIGIIAPPSLTGFCGLDILESIVEDEKAFVKFQCLIEQDINLFVFDKFGYPLNTPQDNPVPIQIDCNSDLSQQQLNFSFDVGSTYILRAQNGSCLKEIYFVIKDTVQEINIPDNNILLVFILLSCVLFITKGFNIRKV
ncbi:MAG: hypothetical protein WC915_00180 [archaeon]|jgi:hypothetical protein